MPLLARSLALNFNHNKSKRIFADPKGHEHDLLAICCISKTMIGWNLDSVATVCRERSGGQGYLSCNRFGEFIAMSHAACTAEGDNRVLMIKIAKDVMTNVAKKLTEVPSFTKCDEDASTINSLHQLLKFREAHLFKQMAAQFKGNKDSYELIFKQASEVI